MRQTADTRQQQQWSNTLVPVMARLQLVECSSAARWQPFVHVCRPPCFDRLASLHGACWKNLSTPYRLQAVGSSAEEQSFVLGQRPWTFLFDLRERDSDGIIWTDENQAELVKAFAAHQLGVSRDVVSQRLFELRFLLPSIGQRVSKMKPPVLAALLEDTGRLANRLVLLRGLFPSANIGAIAATYPELLLQDVEVTAQNMRRVKELLEVEAVDHLLDHSARYLDPEVVDEVLVEMRRLMPTHDAKRVLRENPSWIMRVEKGQKRMGAHPD